MQKMDMYLISTIIKSFEKSTSIFIGSGYMEITFHDVRGHGNQKQVFHLMIFSILFFISIVRHFRGNGFVHNVGEFFSFNNMHLNQSRPHIVICFDK